MKMFLAFVIYCSCLLSVKTEIVYYRPYEYRSAPKDMESNALSFPSSNIQNNNLRPPQIIHNTQSKSVMEEKPNTYSNSLKMDHPPNSDEKKQNSRSEDGNARSSLSFTKPTFESWQPYREQSLFLEPAKKDKETMYKFTPNFDLLEPVTAKMSNKITGLMDILLALAGGSHSNNFIMKGFKQIFIDGIIKPMLLAKGGLKVLISKLSIPFISLLLINVEILITVWWLWEDCIDQPKPVNEPVTILNDTEFRKTS